MDIMTTEDFIECTVALWQCPHSIIFIYCPVFLAINQGVRLERIIFEIVITFACIINNASSIQYSMTRKQRTNKKRWIKEFDVYNKQSIDKRLLEI